MYKKSIKISLTLLTFIRTKMQHELVSNCILLIAPIDKSCEDNEVNYGGRKHMHIAFHFLTEL